MPIHSAGQQQSLPGTGWRGNNGEDDPLPPAAVPNDASAPRDEKKFFGLF
jgi:hypothetical protein